MTAELNFVRQQGFRDAAPQSCGYQYPALMWQPRAIGTLVLIGLALQAFVQAGPYFLALSALLWWNVALPRLNPFDALYNALVAGPRACLAWAPPRRHAASRKRWPRPSCSRSGSRCSSARAP